MDRTEYIERAADAYAHNEISEAVFNVLCDCADIFCEVEEDEELEGPCGEVCNDI